MIFQKDKPFVIGLFGPIGAGKEGVRDALTECFSLIPVSMSEAIREKHKTDPVFNQRFPKIIGQNYPDEAVTEAFTTFVNKYSNTVGFVIDGVPRSPQQVLMILDTFDPERYDVLFLHLLCPADVGKERVRGRRESRKNAGLPVRPDDEPGIVERRLKEHFDGVEDIIMQIRANNAFLIEVSALPEQEDVLKETVRRVEESKSQRHLLVI